MASVRGCRSVSLMSKYSAFMGTALKFRAVFAKPLFGEAKTRTSSDDRIARHSRIRKKVVTKKVREVIAKSCAENGVTKVALDFCGYPYHECIEALVAAAREQGLPF